MLYFVLLQSDQDVLELNTEDDFLVDEEDCSTTVGKNKIGSIWRDIVVGEQMEGCLTHLEVTSKIPGYTDIDNPNYRPM